MGLYWPRAEPQLHLVVGVNIGGALHVRGPQSDREAEGEAGPNTETSF